MKKWAFAIVHAWPSVTGFIRLLAQQPAFALRLLKARFLYFCCRKFDRSIPTPDNFVIETPNELISYWSFFVERESWNREWVRALASASQPLVVDVGANAGLFSHWIWVMRPDVELIAFDPLPRMSEKISRWAERTGARMTVQNKAVADKAGTAEFFASSENDTSASLIDQGGKTMLLSVPVVSLDEVLFDKHVLLLKVDVEGGECAVLEGAKRVLANTEFLILEAHTAGALDRIKRLLGSSWHCQRVGGSDYLFTAASEAK